MAKLHIKSQKLQEIFYDYYFDTGDRAYDHDHDQETAMLDNDKDALFYPSYTQGLFNLLMCAVCSVCHFV